MKLQERSYSSKTLRPKPAIYQEDDGSLIVIATSWGQTEHANRALEEIVKYVNAARSDVEVTSPFEFLTSLSDEVNYLRIALHIANDLLYRGQNRVEYLAGVEVVALLNRGSQIAWAQVGSPNLLIQRKNQSLQPLSVSLDLSSEMSTEGEMLPPLPSHLLGLDPTCHVQCGHSRVESGDQLVLMASSTIAPSLWAQDAKTDFGTITQRMIQEAPNAPFWMGLIQVD